MYFAMKGEQISQNTKYSVKKKIKPGLIFLKSFYANFDRFLSFILWW